MSNKSDIVDKFSIVDSGGRTLLTPFIVSKSKKVLYFHIAKTGGSTIAKILRGNGYDDGVLSNKKGIYEEKLEYFKDVAEHWNDYYKFTFVRNKYDLLYALWVYDKKPCGTFAKFITNIIASDKEKYGYWIDQYFLTTIDGKSMFDFIGRQERFQEGLKIVCDEIGISDYDSNLHVNSARYDHKIPFHSHYDDELKRVVREKFKDEVEYFSFNVL